jgi:hypothetical protein
MIGWSLPPINKLLHHAKDSTSSASGDEYVRRSVIVQLDDGCKIINAYYDCFADEDEHWLQWYDMENNCLFPKDDWRWKLL